MTSTTKTLAKVTTQGQGSSAWEGLQAWALVELYGHQRIVGKVTVDSPEFPGMIRVDVPDLLKDGEVARRGHTRYIGRNALYSVTPVDEQTVRNLLADIDGLPARQASIGSYREW